MDLQRLKAQIDNSPAFIIDTNELQKNFAQLQTLRQQSGCKVLYSVKALPFSRVLETTKPVGRWFCGQFFI
jgi:Diaminopimelate decarboxylase